MCGLVDINLNLINFKYENTANLAHIITQAIFNSNSMQNRGATQ